MKFVWGAKKGDREAALSGSVCPHTPYFITVCAIEQYLLDVCGGIHTCLKQRFRANSQPFPRIAYVFTALDAALRKMSGAKEYGSWIPFG
jgi:hypothetical protein